jgi:hypothetical protein
MQIMLDNMSPQPSLHPSRFTLDPHHLTEGTGGFLWSWSHGRVLNPSRPSVSGNTRAGKKFPGRRWRWLRYLVTPRCEHCAPVDHKLIVSHECGKSLGIIFCDYNISRRGLPNASFATNSTEAASMDFRWEIYGISMPGFTPLSTTEQGFSGLLISPKGRWVTWCQDWGLGFK